jgi:predicted acetyltransferase
MKVSVIGAGAADRPVLRRLLELYQHDFSEFDGRDVNHHGEYGYRYLDHYWTEPNRRPYLFRVNDAWAGFALVRTGDPHDMAEFFVMRKYRRAGVGRKAAQTVLRGFPGRWIVRQELANSAATAFWRRAIPYSYVEEQRDDEICQLFEVIA